MLPGLLLGLVAILSPEVYAIIPAHESGNCLCKLHDMQSKPELIFSLEVVNIAMFYGVNFIFLLVNILMLNRILHVHDKLWVQHECGVMISVWTFFCIFQYFFFLCDQVGNCDQSKLNLGTFLNKNSYVLSYWTMIVRDLSMAMVILWNIAKIKFQSNRKIDRNLTQLSEGNIETHVQLMDFSSIILSVVPLEHFKDFLFKYKREALVFLKVVRIF